MEKKDYNNFVKSMELSHNWYYDDELTSEIRYGLFEPSNELIIEFMEELESGGNTYLVEVIRGCEYTKNVDLLYILTEFMLARYKNGQTMEDFVENELEDVIDCLLASLKTIYRLFKEGVIRYEDTRIARILEDCATNVDNERLKPMLDVLLKQYLGYGPELSETPQKIIDLEADRLYRIQEIKSKYEGKYLYNYRTDPYNSNKISFLVDALKTGMITIEADGTIKSPFIKADNGFKVDPDIIFMLVNNIQVCIIKEAIDDGKITMIEGMDFLKPEKPNEKNYKKQF